MSACKLGMLSAFALAVMLFPANAADDSWSEEYKRGFCDGYNRAAKTVMANRGHYRRLTGRLEMSHKEVIDWIYSKPWSDSATHRTAPRTLGKPPGEEVVGPPDVESVDLYVVISELQGKIKLQDTDGWHFLNCNPVTQ